MMATKSAKTCGDGKRAQTEGTRKRRESEKAGKAEVGRELEERAKRRIRGLLDFSAPMVEEKAP